MRTPNGIKFLKILYRLKRPGLSTVASATNPSPATTYPRHFIIHDGKGAKRRLYVNGNVLPFVILAERFSE
jgi:hypothetical protein